MNRTQLGTTWDRLKNNLTFRVGTVYAGGSWFLVEAADTLGAGPGAIRAFALALASGFLVLIPVVWLLERRAARRDAAIAAADMHWGIGRAVARRRPGTRQWLVALLAFTVVAGGLWAFRSGAAGGAVPEAATRLAVLPFHATGSAEVQEFGTGMVDLLTTALSDVGGIRTVSSRTVLARLGRRDAPGLDQSLEIGRALGAGSVLTGSVTAFGAAVRLTAEIHAVELGDLLARAEVDGPQDSILGLTDRLAVALLRELWRSRTPVPTVRTAALTTSSPSALREYLRGEDHLRGMRFDSAAEAYRRALSLDSTFALAWLRLSDATAWGMAGGEALEVRRTYAARALALADRLPAREQSFVRAQHLALAGAFAAIDSLHGYVQRYPDDPIAWYHLGDARFHAGFLGRFSDQEIIAPFMESTRLDPALGVGLQHVLDMALQRNDRTLFDSVMHHYQRVAPPALVQNRQRQAAVRWAVPDSVVAAFIAGMRGLHPVEQRWAINQLIVALGMKTRLDPEVDPMVYVTALDSLARTVAPDRQWQLRTTFLRGTHLATMGKGERAFAAVASWVQLEPPNAPLPAHLMGALIRLGMATNGEVPREAVAADVQLLEENGSRPFVQTVLHIFFLSVGEPERAARYRYTFEIPPGAPPVDTAAVRRIMGGWTTLLRGDARGLEEVEAGMEQRGFWNASFGIPPYQHALVLSRIPARRAQAIRMLRWQTVHTTIQTGDAYLALARALEAEGDIAGAREAYQHVYRLWHDADSHRHAGRDEAFQALARLRERER